MGMGVLFIGFDYMRLIYRTQTIEKGFPSITKSVKDTLGKAFYPVCLSTPVILFLLCAEAIPHVAHDISSYERQITGTKKEASYTSKCYYYYTLLHVVCGAV